MDRNLLLAFALSFLVLMLWTRLVAPPPEPPEEFATEETVASSQVEEAPSSSPNIPLPAPEAATEALVPLAEGGMPAAAPAEVGPVLLKETALYRAELDSQGASIRHWELREYDGGPREDYAPIVLTTGDPPNQRVLVTPFEELGIGDLSKAIFEVEDELGLSIAFRFTDKGITVRKVYSFREESYGFELLVRVENQSEQVIEPRFAVTWPAAERPGQDFKDQALSMLQDGSVENQPLQSIWKSGFFGGAAERVSEVMWGIDWAGVNMTYFLAAMLPDNPAQARARFVGTEPGRAGVVQVFFEPVRLPPGQATERVFRAYMGPKEVARLEAMGGGLVRAVDLGWSWVAPLTRAFNWLLAALYMFVGNYGVAIIVLTVLVRVVTAPLTNKQMRSMERMRALAPKLQELKEKYGEDKQKQSEQMMSLYRQEGVNPLGGCLPMILQLPVFIGLFYALRSSIHLRHAPFVGWINDLSAPESLFMIPVIEVPLRLLPLVMGGTMILQQRITPMQQMDPAQQKMMMTVMPIVMTVVFYQFASGLVLYWMVSNVLAIAHQLWIGRGMRSNKA
ncbi:MAG: membrane protein insertase YidC [Deltaproteobacteria bacterium]|nr:membrane protein insertase YidC [Deltaproteobacteria bacterium]